jgi:lysyl-tRNA synthetase class 2
MPEESSESDQIRQRRANFDELVKLGVDPYPRAFKRTDTIQSLVSAHGARTGEELEQAGIHTRTSGRIVAIRSFGKANFLVISDGHARIQIYIRQDSLPPRDFEIFRLLDFGDFVGVEGNLFRTKTNELTIRARSGTASATSRSATASGISISSSIPTRARCSKSGAVSSRRSDLF